MASARTCVTIIPAYNEDETILGLVNTAKRYTGVCVIDDCSSDFTPEIVDRISGVQVIHHRRNTHIPGCLRDGMRYALKEGYEYAIFMDAGMSHDPNDLPLFVQHPPVDLLIGCRVKKYDTPLGRDILSRIGNRVYNLCLDFPRTMLERKYSDLTSGFRRYSDRAMKLLLSRHLQSRSFDVMLESAHRIYEHGLSIAEIPVSYRFSNSSLNGRVIGDCISMCFKVLLHVA
jgi:dolichol-phosphate mannosyltransferase